MQRHTSPCAHPVRLALLALGLSFCVLSASRLLPAADASHLASNVDDGRRARRAESFGDLPLRFEENRGQTSPQVRFLSRGSGYTLFLTPAGATLRLLHPTRTPHHSEAASDRAPTLSTVQFKLRGSNAAPKIVGLDEMGFKSNYLVGADERAWQTGVANFSRVKYESVYDGIDLVYYGREGRLEYDFLVAPGARPERIRLSFDGARRTHIDEGGDLLIDTGAGEIRLRKPVAYQESGGERIDVPVRYARDRRGDVRLRLGAYDRARALVIDPVLLYSSYLGGNGVDQGLGVAVDAAGSAYVVGSTGSTDFSVTPGSVQLEPSDFTDAFVLKLSPDGRSLVYATYLGGNGTDIANCVAVDAAGNAYVAGLTGSGSFPTAGGPFQQSKEGGIDAFVSKLNASGSALVYSTFLGGGGAEQVFSIAVDAAGAAYVVGRTDSFNFTRLPLESRAGDPVQKSVDAGATWFASGSGLTASTVNDFAVVPGGSNVVYAGSNLGVFKSTDGGTFWQLTGTARTSTAPLLTRAVAVDPTNSNVVYAAVSGIGGIYKSTDGGTLYEVKDGGLSLFNVNAIAVNPSSPATLYAGASFGIFKSTDGAETWTQLRGGAANLTQTVNRVVINPANTQVIYAATSRGVLKTTDGGANWALANNGLGPFSPPPVAALAIDPANPSTLYAGVQAPLPGLYKSTDGGANWTSASNGLSLTVGGQSFTPGVNTIVLDPASPAMVYAGTSAGLFKSADGGANWARSVEGMTNRNVTALGAHAGASTTLFAGSNVGADAFAAKFNPAGSQLEYLHLLGGNLNDEARGVAVGADGAAYVSGTTASPDFPTTSPFQAELAGSSDAFVMRLGPTGSTSYSTYLGGSSNEQGMGVAVGAVGEVYVTGTTFSSNFPVAHALQSASEGSAFGDAFVTKLNPGGQTLAYSTYLGGTSTEQAFGIAVGADGAAYVTGRTNSTDFPVAGVTSTSLGNDAFLTKLNPAGAALVYSTFLGGATGSDQGNAVAVDQKGQAYVVGNTTSSDLPVVNAVRGSYGAGGGDAFILKFGVEVNLSVSLEDVRDPVMVNNPLTYALKVRNLGPSAATGVSLVDTLPAGVTFVSATATQGACSVSGVTLTCALGDLAAQGSAEVTLVVTPGAAGTVNNTATATANEPESDAANNSATATTKISALPSIAGRVTDAGGAGLAGVNVNLGGAQTSTTQTGPDGRYIFPELPAGGSYTVTPLRELRYFEPQSRTFNNLNADQTADFVSTACTFTLSAPSRQFTAAGGGGSVTLGASDGRCLWSARSNDPWLTLTSPATGTGGGAISFNVEHSISPRTGTLTIAGLTFTVNQAGCGYSVSPGSRAFTAGGGTGRIFVTPSESFCPWTATSNVPWITFGNGAGVGAGSFEYTVAPTSTPRAGRLDVNGRAHAVWQEADSCGSSEFTTTPLYPTAAGQAHDTVKGDFDNDGRLDVVMTHNDFQTQASTVTFLKGEAAGRFAAPKLTALGQGRQPRSLAAADFNRDGKLDLVLADSTVFNLLLLTGDGAGGFAVAQGPALSGKPGTVATGDFNGDGKPDVVTAYFGVAVAFAGDGAGGFAESGRFDLGANSTLAHITPADFNGDGKLDLALAVDLPLTGKVMLALGNGAGGFASPSSFEVSTHPDGGTAADFNRDGKLDLVIRTHNGLSVLFGDGAGGFASQRRMDIRQFVVLDVEAGDFDADGDVDIVYADSFMSRVAMLSNDGSANFGPERTYNGGGLHVEVADFDGDGRLDVVSGNSWGGGLSVMFGDGAGGLMAVPLVEVVTEPNAATVGDFNNDGNPDVIVGQVPDLASAGKFDLLLGDGNGGFTKKTTPLDGYVTAVATGDFNRDGKTDVVFGRGAGVTVLLGDGAGNFGAPTNFGTLVGIRTGSVVPSDVNLDGKLDLVTSDFGGTVYVLFGDGAGGFGAPVGFPVNRPADIVVVGDFNGDGRPDVATLGWVCQSCESTLTFLLGNGAGGFAPAVHISLGSNTQPMGLVAADFNGDGKTDLATARLKLNKLSVLLWNGVDNFRAPLDFDAGPEPSGVRSADFNNDGIPDLLTTHSLPRDVTVFFGDGDGGFAPAGRVHLGAVRTPVTADFNRDGKTDVAATKGEFADEQAFFGAFLNRCSTAPVLRFRETGLSVNEGAGRARIVVDRAGDASSAVTVSYATVNGTASDRADYTAAFGTLTFDAGETSKGFDLLLTDDAHVEGNEALTVVLSGAGGATLGSRPTLTVEVADNDTAPNGTNPADDTTFFVRQHYHDFLNREPDASGLAFWTGEIDQCGADAQCREVKRINVSAAFFLSIEFQNTGYFDYLLYQAAFNTGERLSPATFQTDTLQLGRDVVVGAPGWEQQLAANKQAFADAFVARPAFLNAYPSSLTPAQFVEALNANTGDPLHPATGGALTQPERDALVAALTASTMTRAQVLRAVAEHAEFRRRQLSKAFVLMQYFGYLRRAPNAAPDADFDGYNFWLGKLNQFNGNFIEAEMVKAFISSDEYRQRFGL